jgi:hypothetical protein
VEGNLSVREEENPKIMVSRFEELFDNETLKNHPQTAKDAVPRTPSAAKASPAMPRNVRILYLRVPDLACEAFRRAKNILEIFEGAVPVSIFDASTKTYHKQALGFDCTGYTMRELQKILGEENVVPK